MSNVTLCFVGPSSYPASKNLRNACANAVNNGVKHLTLLISCPGGSTVEGFALYYFLRALPVELTTYNIGSIESMGNMVFLAGDKRFASPHSRFMFHDLTWQFGNGEILDRDHIKERSQTLDSDAQRFVSILKLRSKVTDADLDALKMFKQSAIVPASRAKEVGIVDDVTDAKIPSGQPVYNIDY